MDPRSWHRSANRGDRRNEEQCDDACPECVKLACTICLNEGCQQDDQEDSSFDEIDISTTAWDACRAVIPCKARDHFNILVGSKVEMVTSEGLPFTMDVVKNPDKTYIEGDWSYFRCVYNLVHPDTVKIVYKNNMRGFHLKPYHPRGFIKQPDKNNATTGADMILEGCWYTARMPTLTDSERESLLDMLIEIDQPSLRLLVHRLTATNINKGELKLPRKFVNLLKLEGHGYINFRLGFDEAPTPIGYNISTDGRAICRWIDFVQDWELVVDELVVFQPYFDASGPRKRKAREDGLAVADMDTPKMLTSWHLRETNPRSSSVFASLLCSGCFAAATVFAVISSAAGTVFAVISSAAATVKQLLRSEANMVKKQLTQLLCDPESIRNLNWSGYVIDALKSSSIRVQDALDRGNKTFTIDGCLILIELPYMSIPRAIDFTNERFKCYIDADRITFEAPTVVDDPDLTGPHLILNYEFEIVAKEVTTFGCFGLSPFELYWDVPDPPMVDVKAMTNIVSKMTKEEKGKGWNVSREDWSIKCKAFPGFGGP
ncbi:hypothetical protein EJB05_51767, partial [Eragrostis curvula]